MKCRRIPVVSSTSFKRSFFPFSLRLYSSSKFESKWSSIERFDLPVTTRMSSIPDLRASSTINWIVGLSTIGNISFANALVAGRKRVPSPAAGMTAFLTFCVIYFLSNNGLRPLVFRFKFIAHEFSYGFFDIDIFINNFIDGLSDWHIDIKFFCQFKSCLGC